MKEIFRDSDHSKVALCQSILEAEGIKTFLRNEHLSSTEALIPVFYPALCVVNEAEYEQAVEVLRLRFQADQERVELPDVNCPNCQEENPATFDVCWSCQTELVEPLPD